MSRYRCIEDECLWTGPEPAQLSDPTGQYALAVCPVCEGFAEVMEDETPEPLQGKVGLN
jgi:hypothetical protein